MEYKGDYNLDGFLEEGGASDDLAVAEFVIRDVFHGLLSHRFEGWLLWMQHHLCQDGGR